MNRNILAPFAVMKHSPESLSIYRTYNDEDMFYFTLYWNKVCIPKSRNFHITLPFEKDLIDEKQLERPLFIAPGPYKNDVDNAVFEFSQITNNKLKDENSIWDIHHFSEQAIYADEFTVRKRLLKMEISNCLPIPSTDNLISLHDILEFKARRSAEFQAFHSSINDLYQSILSQPDYDIAKKEAITQLKKALKSLDQTMFEKFKLIKKSGIGLNFDFSLDKIFDSTLKLVGAATVDSNLPTSIPFMTLFTTATSFISFKQEYDVTFNNVNSPLSLEYLAKAKSENLIQPVNFSI